MTDNLYEGAEKLDDVEVEGTTEKLFDSGESTPTSPYKEDSDGKGPPKRIAKRASGENLLANALFGLGSLLVRRRIDVPVGVCLQIESPLAAAEIDKVIAGTFIDRILQPLFKTSDNLEGLGAIIALPIMVGTLERKPEMLPMLQPPIMDALEIVLTDMAPLMRKKKTRIRAAAKSLNLNETYGIAPGQDATEVMFWKIFETMSGEEETPKNGNQP
jgi:hypothetical protein